YQLNKAVEASCNQIAFGYCVCGRVALQKELLFIADTHDSRHEVQYAGMEPHGHYSVPLLLSNDLLGVLTLYLPPGHGEKESDKAFLRRIADVLSIGISKRQTESALEYEAQYDGLTTLPNRSQIILHIDRALARARRHGHIGAVMFIDLDNFKNINDSLGHNIGDEVLRQVSRRLVDTLRKEDMVARLGGDEFVVLLSEEGFNPRTVAQQAQLVAEKIRDAVSQTYVVSSYLLNVTPSIGIALFPENNETTTEVLQQADTAMYRAKAEGRNCTRFFLPVMQMLANGRLTVEQDLRWALDEGKYQLYYQPQVDSAGSIVGAEVLLRCPGRDGNFNRIDLCIDVAESTGLILPIGEWILREACQKLKYWSDNGIAKSLQHLCINISPKQFLQRDFVSLVQRVINETNVDAQRIVLEITESSLIDAKMDAIETMKALKELGIRVAMDDFGTGYSSLSYITQLPLDILKIDRSFVSGISHDHKNAAVVEALMAMARQLDLYLIAEGVETSEDLEFLVQKGCKYFQGFHFSRPQSVNEFTAYMERHS
ncbi:MAG: GGDEF domain-containing protein, partial [Sedimenticola sp.]|nr:GGDEF domain-containing protein [Sedimenticola sp.]